MEEVLHEMRVVETDDGYRIEIKGDKERIKKFLKERGRGFRCAPPFMAMRGMRRRLRHAPPWAWGYEEDDEPEEISE
jgi:hypothetical protein